METSSIMDHARIILSSTQSVCPVCLARLPANRVAVGEDVYLVKECPQHGRFETIVWRGAPGHLDWQRPKIPSHPQFPQTVVDQGCPFDCGLCPEHKQQPCCVLLEVTGRCDLRCPVCFADAGVPAVPDPDLAAIEGWYDGMLAAGGPFNIHLSGGEPCLRDDLPEIIALGRRKGYPYFQVNTNGLRLARDPEYLARLKAAGLSVVYLQFDGVDDGVYRQIRGRELLAIKEQAIERCRQANVGVVLVPTLVPGVNVDQIGRIVSFALAHHPVVRSIHFQPVSFFGRYPHEPRNEDRLTIPEIIRGIETQTDGLIAAASFQPTGSENALCSFHGSFVVMQDGQLKPITQRQKPQSSCCTPEKASAGVARAQSFVARTWTMPEEVVAEPPTPGPSLGGWDAFLSRARAHLFSISGMAFQDAWNLDLDLLQECCIQTVSPDGRMIPFCTYNLTDRAGKSLFRPQPPSKSG
jgi:7,8-dihydro-6-hydroxymethylpterin dimethyltransferase